VENKIAIAHIFLSLKVGGMEKIGTDIIRRMDQNKYDHYIICLDELGFFGEQLEKDGFRIIAMNKGNGFRISLIFRLIQFFKKHNISIVHTNNPSPHFWGGLAAWLAGIKVRVHTKHGRNFITIKRKVFLNKISSFFSHKIVSVSRDSAQLTTQIERVPVQKVMTIYNGVDTDYFIKQDRDLSLFDELQINKNDVIIGAISRFSPDKDYETLIRAFSEIVLTNPESTLLLVGDGQTKNAMIDLAKRLGVNNKVKFSGFRSDILRLLNFIDIYVLSTHTEGISISLLEALSTEKPVIATDVGGNGEIIEHNKNGILVEENNIFELKSALLYLLKNDKERQRLAHDARNVVLAKFQLKNTIRQYEELYEELIRNS